MGSYFQDNPPTPEEIAKWRADLTRGWPYTEDDPEPDFFDWTPDPDRSATTDSIYLLKATGNWTEEDERIAFDPSKPPPRTTPSSKNCSKKQSPFKHCINAICTAFKAVLFSCPKLCKRCFMFCITYDTTCYADLQRAFDSFMRQLREFLGLAPRVRRNKRIVSHPQPHKVGKYRAPHLRPDPHPHLPRDRLQGYHSEPEIPPEGSCSRADEAQDDSDTDNTDEGDHLCLTG